MKVLLSLLILCAYINAITFRTCLNNPSVTVASIETNPKTIIRGNELTVSVNGNSGVEITRGKVIASASMYSVEIIRQEEQLCDHTTCPIRRGDFSVSQTIDIPVDAFPGFYTLKFQLYNETNVEISCTTFKVQIKSS
ncbi:phosphatidylglycerol/phosphatidylinositol transfer protein [Acrasis kona]|uniref:Phosphatidylglycerol/phosphatidylinositol transfer protein n=1 Tax=Acrasis kona TaxID=1008807 RepID=A0AAW2Z4V7_9EUKA